MNKFNVILGNKYGFLTPFKEVKIKNDKRGYGLYYECGCDCGKSKIIKKNNLNNNRTISCGCIRNPDLIGKKFKMFTVIGKIKDKKRKRAYNWKCKCDCGNERILSTKVLQGKTHISCGCIMNRRGKDNPCYNGIEDLPGAYWNKIKHRSKNRNMEFNIDIKYGWDLFLKQNKKCALSGVDIKFHNYGLKRNETTASLDRIDSNKGYLEGNVQWVHKRINEMKSNNSDKEFIVWCKLVANANN